MCFCGFYFGRVYDFVEGFGVRVSKYSYIGGHKNIFIALEV